EIVDEAFLLQDLGDAHLEARERDLHGLVTGEERVANASEHVGDGIGNHRSALLPTRLRDAGDFALKRQVPQANAAQVELAIDRARAPAGAAAVLEAHCKLGLLL